MISSAVYQILHILGIVLVFMSVGALCIHAMNGGTRDSNGARVLVAVTHGIGLLLIVVAGFGMLARLGSMGAGMPGWVWVKVVIWLVLAVAILIPYRKPEWSRALWFALPLLAIAATYSVVYRPA